MFEQKFDYGRVSAPALERIRDLQQRVRRMEGLSAAPDLPLLPALAQVLTVRAGTVCSVDTPGLALALAAGASRAGAWVGFSGVPEVGWEAAAELGIDLDRAVSVPFPREHWLSVTSALIDVVAVVISRPVGRVGETQAAKVSARLRQRGAVLIVDGDWPRAAVRLRTLGNEWGGLGAGHGHLVDREMRLQISTPASRTRTVALRHGTSGLHVVPDTGSEIAALVSPITAPVAMGG